MAVTDWPSSRTFYPADFQVGPDVPQSGWRGIYTGTRETFVHAADRLVATLTLPPCKRDEAAEREAFLGYLLSSGDQVRMPMWQRRYLRGNVAGTLTAGAAAAAGARTLAVAGATAPPNLLLGGGFEVDTDSNGLADGLLTYSTGTSTGVSYTGTAGNGSARAQIVAASSLGTSSGDAIGWRFATDVPVTAGVAYTLAADVYGEPNAFLRLYVDWYTAGLVFTGTPASSLVAITGSFQRRSLTATAPAGAAFARVFIWCQERFNTPVNVALAVDNVQFEAGATATAYAGVPAFKAGDWLGAGGNLLQVRADTLATDTGVASLPLTYPVQKAISSAAALAYSAPTGVWQLDTTGLRFDYTAGVLQDGVALQFRQVIV